MQSIPAKLAAMADDIKLAHSLFALPFALLAAFLAARGVPDIGELVLIVLCMFFARTYAMLANRLLDRRVDATNPRTVRRALPAGRVSARDVTAAVIFCAVAFLACAAMFGIFYHNYYPLIASPVVLIWLGGYALAKRVTPMAHFVLGAALAMSPLAAGLAIDPSYLGRPTLWLLAGFVLLWVGGFDIIYALQDIEHDRQENLRSIPALLGREKSLLAAKAAHLLALLLLVGMQRTTPVFREPHIPGTSQMGYFTLGILLVTAILLLEHRAAKRDRFNMAFFTLNGIIALLLAAAGIADVMLA